MCALMLCIWLVNKLGGAHVYVYVYILISVIPGQTTYIHTRVHSFGPSM